MIDILTNHWINGNHKCVLEHLASLEPMDAAYVAMEIHSNLHGNTQAAATFRLRLRHEATQGA